MPSKKQPVLVRTLVDGKMTHEKIEHLVIYTDRNNQLYVNKMHRRLRVMQEGGTYVAIWRWTSLSWISGISLFLGPKPDDSSRKN